MNRAALLVLAAASSAVRCAPPEAPEAPFKPESASQSPLVGTTCPTQTRGADDPVSVVFRNTPFISTFWVVDSLSQWSDSADPSYASYFHDRLAADRAGADLLAAYADLRRRHSRDPGVEADIRHPDDVLPDTLDAEGRFARGFLCAAGPGEAAAALRLRRDETRTVTAVFDHFQPIVDSELAHAEWMPKAVMDLEALAMEARLEDFLGRALRFFGSGAAMSSPLYVDIVWAPPKTQRATTWSDQMLVPITQKVAGERKELASWLGVIVHEFGHSFLGALPLADRQALSDRIVGTVGIVRQRHSNLIDEATQAALGNIVFMQQRLPHDYDDSEIYAYEPRLEYPDAIDSLARRAAPLLAAHLDEPRGFAGPYLAEVLDAQRKVIPSLLGHFTHAALVLTGDAVERRIFDGLFFGRSRFEVADAAEFDVLSQKGPAISRWAVLTADQWQAASARLASTMPLLDTLSKSLPAGGACLAAARRTSGLGYDVAVLGRDDEAIRRSLIAVSRGMPIPDHPVCTP